MGGRALWLAAWAALLLAVALPLSLLGVELIRDPAALSALIDPLNVLALKNTLLLAFGVVGVAAAVGIPLGFLFGRADVPGKSVFRPLCMAPYIVPPYIAAIAWSALLNPTNGVVNRGLLALGLPAFNIYSVPGMILVMGLESTPLFLLATADALSRMDVSLEEQARLAGSSPVATLRRITLPLALPSLLTAASFVLASAAAAFGVPYLLASGSAHPEHVLTTRIAQALDLDPARGRPLAVALSLALLAVGVGLPALLSRLQGRRGYVTLTGKATRSTPFSLGRWRPVAVAFVALYVVVATVIPIATITITPLLTHFGATLTWENLTLANYREMLANAGAQRALGHSLWLASAAASVAVAAGAAVSWTRLRTHVVGRNALANFARIPYAVPGTVLALGLLLAWSQEIRLIVLERVTFGLALGDSLWILGLAYVVKFLPFPLGQVETGLQAIDPSLEEAARISGAGPLSTVSAVLFPLLRPNLVSAWFLVFMPAFTEVTMSILLAGPNTRVIGTLLFDLQSYGNPPAAAVLAVFVTTIVLGGNLVLKLVSRGSVGF